MSYLTDLQKKLLTMMKIFHEYCEMHSLRYYIVGGTMLGAIRHKGFIPWDDDIDVGMPRKDYEKLLLIFNDSKRGVYKIESVSSPEKNYCYPYAKLYDTSTTLIEYSNKQLKRGIYIDIFPLDGAGDTEDEVKRHFAPIDMKKKLLGLRTIKINKDRAKYKNYILNCFQMLPDFLLNDKDICLQIDKLCKRKDFDSCVFVGNLTGAWSWKEIMSRDLFGKPTLYQFETIKVYGEEKYDEYLTHLYGDWRKLPPKEKQVSHHEYFLDLNKSYLD